MKLFCSCAKGVVNSQILCKADIKMTSGQWKFPLDKNDPKKLGDINFSGALARKFIAKFEKLANVCTEGYEDPFIQLWRSV